MLTNKKELSVGKERKGAKKGRELEGYINLNLWKERKIGRE